MWNPFESLLNSPIWISGIEMTNGQFIDGPRFQLILWNDYIATEGWRDGAAFTHKAQRTGFA